MALRRELLPLLLAAAFLLLGPAQALAAPRFIPSEAMEPTGGAPDVTADTNGNSAAAWNSGGHIYVAQRLRGGAWGTPEDLAPAGDNGAGQDPKIAALPNGELVAAWVVGSDVFAASKPLGGAWSRAQPIDDVCCVVLEDVVAGANRTALVHWNSGDGPAQTAVKPPGATSFGAPQDLSLNNQPTKIAVAPDGSALAAAPSECGTVTSVPCIRAQFRPPGGTWAAPELVSDTATLPRGLGVAARAGSRPFTVAWGEADGSVRSSDRTGTGAWAAPITVPGTVLVGGGPGFTAAGCPSAIFGCFDLASRDEGLAVVWQTGTEVAGSVRTGSGAWVARESVGSAPSNDADLAVAIAADGTPVTAWPAGSGSVGAVVRGAHRSGAGTWEPQDLGTPSAGAGAVSLADVAADGQGDGLAGFSDPGGSEVAGYDGAGPRFSAFSLPSGASLSFSAAAEDNWSNPVSISWAFGDGTGAGGATVSHAYATAGTFVATGTATDAVGNATEQSGPVTVTQTPPPGDPCGTTDVDKDGIKDGCDDNNGAEQPVAFKTVNATVVSGEVFVKLPGATTSQAKAPKGFVPLEGAETIPVGSTLETTKGRVKLRSAATTRGKTQTGRFFRGRFQIRQSRIKRRSRKLITDMRLTGSSFKKACRARASISATRKRSKKRVRRLFGDAKGSFRTSGRNAAATVRGTRWSIQDRCDGTKVTVQRGRVEVRDKVRRKTIIVRTGHTYLARLR